MIGRTLSHYEITALLGKGGMGEVYRATDTQLGREVALKLLPPTLAEDEERLARFQREARTLASLHHPRIASLFGIEEVDGITFLIMELVEGLDLSERLAQSGRLEMDEVLQVAVQIAEGLEFAHDQGVMHRDLKPANIKQTPAGEIKLLDFGLARAFTGDSIDESQPGNSPTITAALTQAGVILGTAAYMSPEQAKGKSVDRRADIWSYGVVLYELMTGERLFQGETASETMADVMKGDISWEGLPANTPPRLRRLLERCLDRDPVTRLRDIGEARIALGQGEGFSEASASKATQSSKLPWAVAAVAAVIALVASIGALAPSSEEGPLIQRTQADLLAGPGLGFDTGDVNIAVSPSGDRLAFVGTDDEGGTWLYLRDLATGEVRKLDGTRNSLYPCWSPDEKRIAFGTLSGISIITLDDGMIERDISSLTSWAMDMAWHPEGWLAVAHAGETSAIYRLTLDHGDLEVIYEPEDDQSFMVNPSFLPDGTILFAGVDNNDGPSGIYALVDGMAELILAGAGNAQYVPSAKSLVYRIDQRIYAQPFDAAKRTLSGEAVRIGGPVRTKTFPNHGHMSVSPEGTLVYLEGKANDSDTELVWRDRAGDIIDRTGIVGDLYSIDISPDGRYVAYDHSKLATAGDIWIYNFARRSAIQYTDHLADESGPVWSKNEDLLWFHRHLDFHRLDLRGAPTIEVIFEDGIARRAMDTHPVTNEVLLAVNGGAERDIHLLDPESGETSVYIDYMELQSKAQFSPDGRWVAFESEHEGGRHVWVESFPARRERFRISNDAGGGAPRWSADGREIYYMSPSRRMMAVPVDMDAQDRSPIGEPEELFYARIRRNSHFEVGAEKDRFLLNEFVGAGTVEGVVLVRGWGRAEQ